MDLLSFFMVQMTSLVLPGMVARKKGVILNIASAAGKSPMPLLTLYSATKVEMTVSIGPRCCRTYLYK